MVRKKSKEYFGTWLARTMATRGLTGGEIARAVEVPDSYVSRWKNGKLVPGQDACQKLAKFLEVDPLRLAVTAGLITSEIAGVEELPHPDNSAIKEAERNLIKDFISKRATSGRDKEALLAALELLKVQDNYANAPEDKIAEALGQVEEVTEKLRRLLSIGDEEE
ncbi:helix-turn-helix domain-containing protein [Streptomyces microflavus]|uniref:helix-turn-helix domain-containing protein n=1 Tax=Streptomyces microflavus TaxID=1919 RepID=UPI0036CBDF2C